MTKRIISGLIKTNKAMPAELQPHIEREADISSPDTQREGEFRVPEVKPVNEEAPSDADSVAAVRDAINPHPQIAVTQVDAKVRNVEHILSAGLEATYAALDPATQTEFRVKGEEAARSITEILSETKVKVRNIIKLISDWLKIIPGVSKFFIEQEAKIKTDRLLGLRHDSEE